MRFTLTYDGELRPDDGPKAKWRIRQQLEPQLKELWDMDPNLQQVKRRRYLPRDGFWNTEVHHSLFSQLPALPERNPDHMDLLEPITVGQHKFRPLVRDSHALRCSLRILFLRREEPGRLYQAGDLDNRLKTLLDSLSVPQHSNQLASDNPIDEEILCLVEDDRLITGIEVETHRLLGRPEAKKHEVHLVIQVVVHVVQPHSYNQMFLGD